MAWYDSDSDFDLRLSSEFELSDDGNDIGSDASDIESDLEDNDYQEQGEESDSDNRSHSDSVSMASSDFSLPPSPPPHTFRLLQDPFADRRPNDLPALIMDFPDVNPEVIHENENRSYSSLDCFLLFMGDVWLKNCVCGQTLGLNSFSKKILRKAKKVSWEGAGWAWPPMKCMFSFLCNFLWG